MLGSGSSVKGREDWNTEAGDVEAVGVPGPDEPWLHSAALFNADNAPVGVAEEGVNRIGWQ